ncbi:TetR/AcrR family transcriptional regulator [Clostridium tyrobutyricum]|jgi:AcrR family transcriptional regulator|uniref:TetR/AcrR family transcriptional regulator n=1 Tax=Clostridium tyrobutyricum TaxID=1519 RepID=UPI001C3E3BD1|nr:TetR/AcrR family transcriptional regulator [Clostridium tyrobutyricum]MBV4438240.1 TetR/AcrR family transcriptional regulator [Clostridium tyrobutyricum]
MANTDENITPRLLESARIEFREKGFEKASINMICKNAQIITGALYKRFDTKEELFNTLVKLPAQELRRIIEEENLKYHKLSKEEQLNKAFANWHREDTFIDYIYKYHEEFLLILKSSGGTKYELYFDEISEIITDSTLLFIIDNNRSDIEEEMLKPLIHILVSSHIKGILEPLLHNMTLKQAKTHVRYLERFFYVGWKDLLKL